LHQRRLGRLCPPYVFRTGGARKKSLWMDL
jgi:hypothetical protein